MIYTDRPEYCGCSFCENVKEMTMKKDIDGDYDSDDKAPFNPYEPGLDPKIGYKQKFNYAPDDLYPRHYNTKNK